MSDADHNSSIFEVSAGQLAADFGAQKNSIGRRVVQTLYGAACSPSAPISSSFDEWRTVFSTAYGPEALLEPAWTAELASRLGIDPGDIEPGDGPRLLFATHTYFAIVVKLIAARHLRLTEGKGSPTQALRRIDDPDAWASAGPTNLLEGDVFGWHVDIWSASAPTPAKALVETANQYPPGVSAAATDLFKPLYQTLIPTAVRHDLGEYYTPRWLAELSVDEVGYSGDLKHRITDPACGSGTFLMEAIRRIQRRGNDAQATTRRIASAIVENVVGLDVNPLAVLAARANMLIALGDLAGELRPFELPVHCCDALPSAGTVDLFAPTRHRPDVARADFVVGNPPWVNWQHLSTSRRDELKPLWQSYGLFSLDGSKGRLGGGKKDLSMLFAYAAVDEYLKVGGTLGFLITHSVFQSRGAGDGFRRFRYDDDGNTVYLKPEIVHDFTDFQPFDGASTNTALLCVSKSSDPVDFPVDYHRWTNSIRGRIAPDATLADARQSMALNAEAARPVDPDHDASPWLVASFDVVDAICRVVGPSDYTAYEGVNSGGLNACYWVRELESTDDGATVIENLADVGHIDVEPIRTEIESNRLFPLLRSGDLERWNASAEDSIILAQDPQTRTGIPESTMRRKLPKTYRYFRRFEGDVDDPQRGTLRGRSLFRRYYEPSDPFYSMYGVGPYTMADWKVCWTRIDTRLRAAVVGPDADGRTVLPQETITFVPFDDPDEAHYFCALFNSTPADALVRSFSTGKGFASAHVLDTLAIPRFDSSNKTHLRLCEDSKKCHRAAGSDDLETIFELQEHIDDMATKIWAIDDDRLRALRHQFSS